MVTNKTRRQLLKTALLGAAYPLVGCVSTPNQTKQPVLVGCAITGRGRYSAVVADQFGMPIHSVPLPDRGHGVASHPQLFHAVAFGRRPGTYFQVFNVQTGHEIKLRPADPNRHYYGHGVYSNDGQWLYATEGERGTSKGIIGVYDVASDYKKVAEFTDFGLGPHEVIVMPNDSLVIGVGGVHTNGREPLNLSSMKPSLSYLNSNGQLIEQVGLVDKKLSIRHLAHDGDETVLCGQQYRGEPDEYPSLLAMHKAGGALIPLEAEPEQWARFEHYIASIAATNEWILATSPRGNCYGIWSKETRKLVELAPLPDASGVVVEGEQFKVSSGSGAVISQAAPSDKQVVQSGVQWDNHWAKVSY